MPNEIPSHAETSSESGTSPFVDRPLGDGPLGFDTGYYPVQVCFDNDPPYYHFPQRRVKRLEVED